MSSFKECDWRALRENIWEAIGREWMLVTAGELASWNTMTASWGGVARLWDMDLALAFVRPSRYTAAFLERSGGYTLSFLEPGKRESLNVCGSRSGRDTDKAAAAGLSPLAFRSGAAPERVSFGEARLVLSCRTVYTQDLDPSRFADPAIAAFYRAGDYHRLYAGAVEAAWIRE